MPKLFKNSREPTLRPAILCTINASRARANAFSYNYNHIYKALSGRKKGLVSRVRVLAVKSRPAGPSSHFLPYKKTTKSKTYCSDARAGGGSNPKCARARQDNAIKQ